MIPPCSIDSASPLSQSHNDERESEGGPRFRGALDVLYEYIGLCVDWTRIRLGPVSHDDGDEDNSTEVLESDEQKKKLSAMH